MKTDPRLRSLLPKYLENRKKDLRELREALCMDNFELIKNISHSIRGHAASYGFESLTEICKKIEQATPEKNHQLIKSLLDEYDEYVSSVELPGR